MHDITMSFCGNFTPKNFGFLITQSYCFNKLYVFYNLVASAYNIDKGYIINGKTPPMDGMQLRIICRNTGFLSCHFGDIYLSPQYKKKHHSVSSLQQ